jgi:hypothetical protein
MSRSLLTLTSVLAVALALSLVPPQTSAHATNTWDAVGVPITGAPVRTQEPRLPPTLMARLLPSVHPKFCWMGLAE